MALGDSPLSDREMMRDHAVHVLGDDYSGLTTCGTLQNPQSQVGVYWHSGGHLAFEGVRYCSQIWVCPVCSPIANRQRNRLLLKLWDHWKVEGAQCATFTLTAGFPKGMSTSQRFKHFHAAYTRMTAGRDSFRQHWQSHEFIGYFAIVEILYSIEADVWCPHLHGIALFHGPVPATFREWLAAAWKRALRLVGLNDGDGFAVDDQFDDEKAAVAYICQPMDDREPEGNSLTPLQVLRASMTGETQYIYAFCDYAAAVKRIRHVRHSQGLLESIGEVRSNNGVTKRQGVLQDLITPEEYGLLLDDFRVGLFLAELRGELNQEQR